MRDSTPNLSTRSAAQDDSRADGRLPADSIGRNTAYAFAAQLASAGFTAVLTVFLLRRLGPSSYGLFALALSVGGLVILPADLGISGSVARLIARAHDEDRTRAAVLADAIRLKAATTGLASLALFLLADVVADAYHTNALVWPIRIVALSVLAESTLGLLTNAFVALRRVSLNFYVLLSESALETGLSVLIVVLGGGTAGALAGRAAAYGFACVLALVLAGRHIGAWTRHLWSRSAGQVRAIASYASALALVESSWIVFARIDGILIGAFLTVADVAFFQAPIRLTAFLSYPGSALAAGVAPTLARPESVRPEAFTRALRFLAVLQVAIVVPAVVWAHPIIHLLLGPKFGHSAVALQALAPYVFLSGFAPLVSIAVDYLGDARKRIPITLVTVAINVVLDALLIPRIGILGAAVGTDVAFAIYVPAHLWLCARRVELDLWALAATLARLTVAGAAATAVLVVVGRGTLSAGAWLGGGALAVVAFTAALVLTRELTIEEAREVASMVRSRGRFRIE